MLLTMHVRSYSVELGMMGSYLCIRMDYVDEVELLFEVFVI